jgi:hypothetical protein
MSCISISGSRGLYPYYIRLVSESVTSLPAVSTQLQAPLVIWQFHTISNFYWFYCNLQEVSRSMIWHQVLQMANIVSPLQTISNPMWVWCAADISRVLLHSFAPFQFRFFFSECGCRMDQEWMEMGLSHMMRAQPISVSYIIYIIIHLYTVHNEACTWLYMHFIHLESFESTQGGLSLQFLEQGQQMRSLQSSAISTHSHHSQHNLRYFWYLLMLKVSGCKDLQRQSDMILPTQSRKFTDIHRISAGWKIEILWSSWLRFSPSYKGLMRCLIKQAILGTNALKLREPSHGRGINLRSITGERIGCLAVLMPGLAMFCSNVIKSQQIMTVVFYQETTNVVSSCAPRP